MKNIILSITLFIVLLFGGCTSNIYKNSVNIDNPDKICRVLNTKIAEFYQGDCKNNLADGYGKAQGEDIYEGQFKSGKLHGKGIYRISNGNSYEGKFRNNMMHGKGIYIWSDGKRYEGDYVNGKRIGKGMLIWPDGDMYKGEWLNGRFTGKGMIIHSNGKDTIEGQFRNEKLLDGKVIITLDLHKRSGMYVNGKLHGKVRHTHPSGYSETEHYLNGENVSSYVKKCELSKNISSVAKGFSVLLDFIDKANDPRGGQNQIRPGSQLYEGIKEQPIIKSIGLTCNALLQQLKE